MKLKKIAIHSVPRSGSSWLGSILDSSPNTLYRYQPLFSYSHKGQLSENSDFNDIRNFFSDIVETSDDFVLQKDGIKKGIIPVFSKENITHVVYKEVRYHHILKNILLSDPEILVVGLIRSPFAVINSWIKAPKEFREDLNWKLEEEWRFAPKKNLNKPEEFNGFEKWKEVTFLFLELQDKFPNQFYLLKYEDLLKDRYKATEGLFRFCGLEIEEQTMRFLNHSSKSNHEDAYSVFKTKVHDVKWNSTLPEFITQEIKQDEEFKQLNKKFKWIS